MKSRFKIIVIVLALASVFSILTVILGYQEAFRLFLVNPMPLPFADLRVVTHAAESIRQGFDPVLDNPFDPWCRPLPFPPAWKYVLSWGITPNHTLYIGLVWIALYLGSICFVFPTSDNLTLGIAVLALISYASLLAIERTNTDLIIFFLLTTALGFLKRAPLIAVGFIFIAFMLKAYPLIALAALLTLGRRKFIIYASLLLALATLHVIFNFSDFVIFVKLLPQLSRHDLAVIFGMKALALLFPNHQLSAQLITYLAMAVIVGFALSALFRDNRVLKLSQDAKSSFYLDAFRMGAAVHLGVFLTANSYAYKLIFLILTLPQLSLWLRMEGKLGLIFKVITGALIISLHGRSIVSVVSYFIRPLYFPTVILIQMIHWFVFASLLYLFIWTLPKWVKNLLMNFSLAKNRPHFKQPLNNFLVNEES